MGKSRFHYKYIIMIIEDEVEWWKFEKNIRSEVWEPLNDIISRLVDLHVFSTIVCTTKYTCFYFTYMVWFVCCGHWYLLVGMCKNGLCPLGRIDITFVIAWKGYYLLYLEIPKDGSVFNNIPGEWDNDI